MSDVSKTTKVSAAEHAARMAFFCRTSCRAIDHRDGGCIHEDGNGDGCDCLDAAREIIAAYKGAESNG